MLVKWEEGIPTDRKCSSCYQTKNAIPNFGIAGGKLLNRCKECANAYAREYGMKTRGYKFKCKLTFDFDGKRLCRECDKVQPKDHFYKSRAVCKPCLGVPLTEEEKIENRKNMEYRIKYRPLNEEGDMLCLDCDTFKPLDEYYKHSVRIGTYGRSVRCKVCDRKLKRDKYKEGTLGGKNGFIERFNNMKEEVFKC